MSAQVRENSQNGLGVPSGLGQCAFPKRPSAGAPGPQYSSKCRQLPGVGQQFALNCQQISLVCRHSQRTYRACGGAGQQYHRPGRPLIGSALPAGGREPLAGYKEAPAHTAGGFFSCYGRGLLPAGLGILGKP